MADIDYRLQDFINAYAQGLGQEAAVKVVREAIARAGIASRDALTRDEALSLCESLKKTSGFVKIIAIALTTRITLHTSLA